MKIALISEHASPLAHAGGVDSGGQNIYVAHIALQLAAAGHQVDVFTRMDDPSQERIFRWRPGLRVIHVPAGPAQSVPKEELLPHMAAFGDFLLRFMHNDPIGYDVVHANFFMSGIAALRATELLNLPLVVTFHALGQVRKLHQGSADRFPPSRFAIEQELVRRADCIIAECPQDHEDLVELYAADPTRIKIVPCGFDAAEFSPQEQMASRRALGWNADEFSVLQLGRMVPRKGVDNVIRGVADLRRRHGVHARLYVVGGNSPQPDAIATPELGRLMGIAEAEGIADAVTFCGQRDRAALCALYSAADVFVTTPWYEPFGITPIEAMACARPVLGADVGGIRYSVEHGRTGFLVPPRNPEALADRLATLAGSRELREQMGRNGRARAERMFTWRGVARDILRIYADVVHVHASGAMAIQYASAH